MRRGWSRRAFVQGALGGAAGASLGRRAGAMDPADRGARGMAPPSDLTALRLAGASELVRKGKVSPVELTRGQPPPHRSAEPAAQRVHHGHGRIGAGAGP